MTFDRKEEDDRETQLADKYIIKDEVLFLKKCNSNKKNRFYHPILSNLFYQESAHLLSRFVFELFENF